MFIAVPAPNVRCVVELEIRAATLDIGEGGALPSERDREVLTGDTGTLRGVSRVTEIGMAVRVNQAEAPSPGEG